MRSRVVGVLAGDQVEIDFLREWLSTSDRVIAADGGADLVLESGFIPEVLVGDLDSVSPEGRATARRVEERPDQNTTDCEKLLAFAFEEGVHSLVLCGLEGSRVDHSLAIVQAVARWPGTAVLAYRHMLGHVMKGPSELEVSCHGFLSLLPLEKCAGVSVEGVKWPLTGVTMEARGLTSVSNFCEGSARVRIEYGAALLLTPYDGKPVWG